MFHSFDRFFERQPNQLGKHIHSSDLNLMMDGHLEDWVGQIEAAPMAEQYPLQIRFYQQLMDCHLLLPVPANAKKHKGFPLMVLQNGQREKAVPVFTNEENLGLWTSEPTDYVALPLMELCRYAMEAKVDYLVLNVAGPFGCEIAFHDFSYLAEGLLPPPSTEQSHYCGQKPGEVVIEKNTPMRLGLCDGLSPGLMDRLQHVFQHHQELISRVYLFDVAFNEGPLQPALGVRMPEGAEDRWEVDLWPTMQAVLYEMLERREVVNVFLLNQAGSMEQYVQQMTIPIYDRHSA
jgi:hypothetical protein